MRTIAHTLLAMLFAAATIGSAMAQQQSGTGGNPPATGFPRPAAALAKNQYNVDGKLPPQITINKGDSLQFLRLSGLVGTNVKVELAASTSVLKEVHTRHVNPFGWRMVAEFSAQSAGKVDIKITHTVPGPASKSPKVETITIVVN